MLNDDDEGNTEDFLRQAAPQLFMDEYNGVPHDPSMTTKTTPIHVAAVQALDTDHDTMWRLVNAEEALEIPDDTPIMWDIETREQLQEKLLSQLPHTDVLNWFVRSNRNDRDVHVAKIPYYIKKDPNELAELCKEIGKIYDHNFIGAIAKQIADKHHNLGNHKDWFEYVAEAKSAIAAAGLHQKNGAWTYSKRVADNAAKRAAKPKNTFVPRTRFICLAKWLLEHVNIPAGCYIAPTGNTYSDAIEFLHFAIYLVNQANGKNAHRKSQYWQDFIKEWKSDLTGNKKKYAEDYSTFYNWMAKESRAKLPQVTTFVSNLRTF